MKRQIVLIGGGGHCLSCMEVINAGGGFKIAGIVDQKDKIGRNIAGYPVIGCDEDLPSLYHKLPNAFFLITIGQILSPETRVRIYRSLKKIGARLPVIISPRSVVSESAQIGEGTIVMHGAVVNSGARIGANCIVNTNAVLEHETDIGEHCHISTGSIVNGECRIGAGTFVGSGAVLANNTCVAGQTIIGAGSVVIRNINEKGTYAGNPARRIH